MSKTRTQKLDKTTRKRGWIKYFLFICVLAFAMFLGGFFAFASHVDKLNTPSRADVPKADGIVVWTGKGGGRLEAAGQLLRDEKGERLLVSGVNDKLELARVAELIGISEDMATCCVDLDYAAEDTAGNARETAAWAKVLDYEHIILVTSAYHMPRAQVEISTAAGRMRITPFPVMRDNPRKWHQDRAWAKRLFQEYSKLLLSYSRGRRSETEAPVLPSIDEESAGETAPPN
jgi:uncharacterized SAM-binding protein YcdF (DUF218 family)